MKKLCMLFLGLVLLVSASGSAFADGFSFNFTAADYSGSGLFTAVPTGTAGQYLVIGVSGMVDTGAKNIRTITGVLPVAPSLQSFESNDNLLFFPAKASGAFFDLFGVSFVLSNGAEVNLYGQNGSFLMKGGPNGNVLAEDAVINVAAAPEPTSLVLLGTGLVGGLATMRRRFVRV